MFVPHGLQFVKTIEKHVTMIYLFLLAESSIIQDFYDGPSPYTLLGSNYAVCLNILGGNVSM